jgi:hypothetical protein
MNQATTNSGLNGVVRPLRFALRSERTTLPAWQARCICELRSGGFADLVLRIAAQPVPALKDGRLWAWLKRHFFRAQALAPVDLREEIAAIPSLTDSEAPTQCERLGLDFVLDFGVSSAGSTLRSIPRYGIWSFEPRGSGEGCGVWETFGRSSVTTASLGRQTEENHCVVLRRGVFKTEPHSLDRTQNSVLLNCVEWPRQVCVDIRNGVADYLNAQPVGFESAMWRSPNALQAIALLGKLAGSRASRILRALFCHPLWTIGVANASIEAFLDPSSRPAIKWLPEPPDGTFIADPFAVSKDGKLSVLYEDFCFHDNRGHIACREVLDGERTGPAQTVFAQPVHMSYPYLFQHEGNIYCIPETHEAREAVLYEAVEFPTRWRRAATLLKDFPACDSTVFQHEGRWWLACTSHDAASSLNLFLWHATELAGPWQQHAANPVKTDVTSSRPAGTPFVCNGSLYRPAQDCSERYGGRVIIHRILRLTPTEFREEPVAVVKPDQAGPYGEGLHTIAACGNLTVVDGLRITFRPRAFLANLQRYARFAWSRVMPRGKQPVRGEPLPSVQAAASQAS